MSDEHVYRVVVTVEDGKWLASVPELDGAHTYEPNLVALDWSIREVIALIEDLQDGVEQFLKLAYEFEGDAADADFLMAGIRREHMRLRNEQETLLRQAGAAAAHLMGDKGMTLVGAADALGVSPAYLHQGLRAYDPTYAGKAPERTSPPQQQSPRRSHGAA